MDIADEIVVSEGLAPSSERDLLEKIAAALDAERAAVVAALRRFEPGPMGLSLVDMASVADNIERGEHRREEEK
jgi:hypothetical protein